jgi:hypothetical protein
MLRASRDRIESLLGEDLVVLDVGGWAAPLARADWVIDLLPHDTRGLYGEPDPEAERFSAETWVVRDICDRKPWPFEDDQFDFAICSHTLEDVRDPIWVCSELSRVARAGYVETPSRLEEQSLGVAGPFVGWSHHHWLVDPVAGGLEFTFKPHALHAEPAHHFSAAEGAELTAEERVVAHFWRDELEASERIHFDEAKLHADLAAVVADNRERLSARARARTPAPPRSARRWLGGSRAGR